MTKMELSEAAVKALINAKGTAVGAPVEPATFRVDQELQAAGLVGHLGGLTRKGSIAAMRLKRQAEEDAFSL